MTKAPNNVDHNDWAVRGARAVKAGALFSMLSLIALVGTHVPMEDPAMPEAQSVAQAAPQATAYYFPAQYELNAPEPGEPAPTF